ncbi:hypothetical protein [Vulgatibacter sp.]|uniref:hypothetical protein n=1 Tax=Vulgatibacter sp. TaxID=1971226 RepID=UPI00356712C1
MNDARAQWRGLQALVQEAVDQGSRAIEQVQLETAKRPFRVLEQLPAIGPVAGVVHAAHTISVMTSHAIVRTVNEAAGAALAQVIDVVASDRRR